MFGWFKRRRRRKLLASPLPSAWAGHLRPLPFFGELEEAEQVRLQHIARVLIHEKHWEGCGGLELTEEVQVVIAAQAALLILAIEHDYYRRVTEILVYPDTYRTQDGDTRLGEAWHHGPMVLSWQQANQGPRIPNDGQNVVLHEFAHALDFLDGVSDGTPPLPARSQYKRWAEVMNDGFEELKTLARKGRRSVLDKYGATNEAEFFAVATETFFEKPIPLQRKLPDLYALLCDYYRQDPRARAHRAQRARERA